MRPLGREAQPVSKAFWLPPNCCLLLWSWLLSCSVLQHETPTWDPTSYKPALWRPLLSLLLKGSSPTCLLLLLSPASSPRCSYKGTCHFNGRGRGEGKVSGGSSESSRTPSGLPGPLTPMPSLLGTLPACPPVQQGGPSLVGSSSVCT